MEKKKKLIVILGPTAVGKTKLAVKLASVFNGEIVSADSRQVYRRMDVGTGKDIGEYGNIPYHLIDIVSPNTKFSLAKYQKFAYKAIDDIIARKKLPFLVGGTGLYIQVVVDGMPLLDAKPDWQFRENLEKWNTEKIFKELKRLDPKLEDEIIQGNKRRMIRYIEIMRARKKPISVLWKEQEMEERYDCLLLGVFPNPPSFESLSRACRGKGGKGRFSVNTKIDQRIDVRLKKEGMVEEVERLHKEGVSWKRLKSFGLEYKFISQYLQGKIEYNEMVDLLKIASHQFAKRQMTWFKKDKRIKWITKYGEAKKEILKFLNF